VACHGPSLARDAQRLMEAGYVPRRLVPADMLPQTPHVEWIASFERE
jgi:tRNA/tmRNA/rRNA uracil-C5-methylase (TrmA/RlmC/RlmD family)